MVENASSISKNLGGRPPEFDRDEVVAAAIHVFWTKGFTATTVSDLEAATGTDRSSLYKSFGGKNGLYESAANAYVAMADEQLFAPLHRGTGGLEDIVEFIDFLANSYRSVAPKGCLIVNDMADVGEQAATRRYLERLEGGFRCVLERASTAGQVDASLIEQRTQVLTAAIIGINLANRYGADPTATDSLIEGLRTEVKSWLHSNQTVG